MRVDGFCLYGRMEARVEVICERRLWAAAGLSSDLVWCALCGSVWVGFCAFCMGSTFNGCNMSWPMQKRSMYVFFVMKLFVWYVYYVYLLNVILLCAVSFFFFEFFTCVFSESIAFLKFVRQIFVLIGSPSYHPKSICSILNLTSIEFLKNS